MYHSKKKGRLPDHFAPRNRHENSTGLQAVPTGPIFDPYSGEWETGSDGGPRQRVNTPRGGTGRTIGRCWGWCQDNATRVVPPIINRFFKGGGTFLNEIFGDGLFSPKIEPTEDEWLRKKREEWERQQNPCPK